MPWAATTTDTSYSRGYDEGVTSGEFDLAEGLAIHHDVLAERREWAAMPTLSREGRAFFLGWLRGYRAAVRTYKWGRWGT